MRRGGRIVVALVVLGLLVAAVGCGPSASPGNAPSDRTRESPARTLPTPSAHPADASTPDSEPPTRTKELKFASVESAVAYLRQRLDVRVALPTYLPAGIEFAPHANVLQVMTRGEVQSAQLTLMMGPGRPLIVQLGQSAFDGCAPEESVAVRVNGQDALLKPAPHWVDLIWPATHHAPGGVYGLSGSLSRNQMLHLAATMPRVMARPMLAMGC